MAALNTDRKQLEQLINGINLYLWTSGHPGADTAAELLRYLTKSQSSTKMCWKW